MQDSGGRSEEGSHETDSRTSETACGKFKEAAALATCHLSRAPRAAERGSA